MSPFMTRRSLFTLAAASLSVGCARGEDRVERPELEEIHVGALPIVDVVGLDIAEQRGYFAAEGLRIQVRELTTGADAVPDLESGKLQFAVGSYVSWFTAHLAQKLDLCVVADCYQAQPNVFMIMGKPGSRVRGIGDMEGRKLAVNALDSITTLIASSTLRAAGVRPATVKFVTMPFPQMHDALSKGAVDAALMAEPYITDSQLKNGTIALADAASGPTRDIAVAGWAANRKFVTANPRTARAFQRAVQRGQIAATKDRSLVQEAVMRRTRVDHTVADLMHLGRWPDSLNEIRLDRVVGLMREHGGLDVHLDTDTVVLRKPE
ncbi:ABC transporter substrate-binding protein [Lentzea sp. JNUCC 0626]|uniref:ABC transporter substrate-binding protein n=1 Tax=Lentzea sp. JNUCC 0626 TaxID=3367513 RepID=UPI003749BB87